MACYITPAISLLNFSHPKTSFISDFSFPLSFIIDMRIVNTKCKKKLCHCTDFIVKIVEENSKTIQVRGGEGFECQLRISKWSVLRPKLDVCG